MKISKFFCLFRHKVYSKCSSVNVVDDSDDIHHDKRGNRDYNMRMDSNKMVCTNSRDRMASNTVSSMDRTFCDVFSEIRRNKKILLIKYSC